MSGPNANVLAHLTTLESQYTALRTQYKALESTHTTANNTLTDLRNTLVLKNTELDALRAKNANYAEAAQLTLTATTTSSATEAATNSRNDRLLVEIDNLNAEIERLTKACHGSNKDKASAQTNEAQAKAAMVPVNFELERTKKEKEVVSNHSAYLETELNKALSDLATAKRNASNDIISLKGQLNDATNSNATLTLQAHDLKNSLATATLSATTYSSQLRTAATDGAATCAAYDTQILNLEGLNGQLKRSVQDMQGSVDEHRQSMQALKESARSQSSQQEEAVSAATAALKASHESVVAQQKATIAELRSSSTSTALRPFRSAADTAVKITTEGHTLHEVYGRMLAYEQELETEKAAKAQLNLAMEKILAEFELKAPIIKRQQREHQESAANLQRMGQRAAAAEAEARAAQTAARQLETATQAAVMAKTVAEKENAELAQQVRTLLTSQMSPDSTSSPLDLQVANQELVRSNASLSSELQRLAESDDRASVSTRLEEALSELDSIRHERQRQETMVTAIVQQRDMYRTLLSQADAADGPANLAITDGSAPKKQPNIDSTQTIELKNKLYAKNLEVDRLNETISRLKDYEAASSATLSSTREALSSAKIQLAQQTADATHYKQKAERLTVLVEDSQKESKRTSDQFSTLQGSQLSLQNHLAECQNDVNDKLRKIALLEGELRSSRMAKDVSDGAEQRARDTLEQTRRELLQQQNLSESVARIEVGLANQANEQVTKLTAENEKISSQLSDERKRSSEERLLNDRKVNSLSDEIRGHQSKAAEHVTQLAGVSSKLQTAHNEVSLLKDKVASLGRQLMSASSSSAASVAQLVDISTLAADSNSLESTRNALVKANVHLQNYKKIADDADRQLKDMSSSYEKYRTDMTAKVAELTTQLAAAKKTLTDKVALVDSLGGDLVKQREAASSAEKRLAADKEAVKREYAEYKSSMGRSEDKLSEMTREVATHAAVAKTAQENYERELTLHANARTAVREARDELEAEKSARVNFENASEAVNNEIAATKSVFDGERAQLAKTIEELEKSVDNNKKQNALLHSQIKVLSGAAEKLGEGGTAGEGGEDSELRQIVNFMRSESEMMESKIAVLKRELDCERASCSVAKRSLDEARGELKRKEAEAEDGPAASEEHAKLMGEVNQLNLLRESNSMLREDSEKVKGKLAAAEKGLKAAQKAKEPLSKKIRELEELNSSFKADKESLGKEAANWKNRVKALTSKFDQIDPQEFTEAKEAVEGLKTEAKEAAAQSGKREELIKKMRGDYTKAKHLVDTLKKERDFLKEKLEGAKDGEGSLKEENEELRKTMEVRESDLSNANKRLEKFRDLLRKNKEDMDRQKKQVAELEGRLAQGEGGGEGKKEAGGGGGMSSMSRGETPPPPMPQPPLAEKKVISLTKKAEGGDTQGEEAALKLKMLKKKELEEKKKKLELQKKLADEKKKKLQAEAAEKVEKEREKEKAARVAAEKEAEAAAEEEDEEEEGEEGGGEEETEKEKAPLAATAKPFSFGGSSAPAFGGGASPAFGSGTAAPSLTFGGGGTPSFGFGGGKLPVPSKTKSPTGNATSIGNTLFGNAASFGAGGGAPKFGGGGAAASKSVFGLPFGGKRSLEGGAEGDEKKRKVDGGEEEGGEDEGGGEDEE